MHHHCHTHLLQLEAMKPTRTAATAKGHCRDCKRRIDLGDRITIWQSKWYHTNCYNTTIAAAANPHTLLKMNARQRLAVALDNTDRSAAAARLNPAARRKARLAAKQAAVRGQEQANLAFYGRQGRANTP